MSNLHDLESEGVQRWATDLFNLFFLMGELISIGFATLKDTISRLVVSCKALCVSTCQGFGFTCFASVKSCEVLPPKPRCCVSGASLLIDLDVQLYQRESR